MSTRRKAYKTSAAVRFGCFGASLVLGAKL